MLIYSINIEEKNIKNSHSTFNLLLKSQNNKIICDAKKIERLRVEEWNFYRQVKINHYQEENDYFISQMFFVNLIVTIKQKYRAA